MSNETYFTFIKGGRLDKSTDGFLWTPNSNNLLLSDVSLYSFIILPYFVFLIDLYSYSVMIVLCFVYFIGIE